MCSLWHCFHGLILRAQGMYYFFVLCFSVPICYLIILVCLVMFSCFCLVSLIRWEDFAAYAMVANPRGGTAVRPKSITATRESGSWNT